MSRNAKNARKQINSERKKPEKRRRPFSPNTNNSEAANTHTPIQSSNTFYRWWNTLSTAEKAMWMGFGVINLIPLFYVWLQDQSNTGSISSSSDSTAMVNPTINALTIATPAYPSMFFADAMKTKDLYSNGKKVKASRTAVHSGNKAFTSDTSSQSFFTHPMCPPNAFDALTSEFLKRLILTPETEAYYNENPGLKEKDIQRIKDFIKHAAGQSQSIYCKIESILRSDSFTFELSAGDRYLKKETHGESNPKLNRLIMPCGISKNDFHRDFYVFIHEIHHQSIGISNKQKKFFSDGKENFLSAIELPFGSSSEDVAEEAQKFEQIIKQGNKRAENLLKLSQKRKSELNSLQRESVDKLRRYAYGYIPPLHSAFLIQENIAQFKKEGHVKDNLSLTKKYFVVSALGVNCYVQSISYINNIDRYEMQFYTAASDASIVEKILLDLKWVINANANTNNPQKLLTQELPKDAPMQNYKGFQQFVVSFEADACIHQILELHHGVLDMLFSELIAWHRKRLSESHLKCLKDPDYMSHAQSSSENTPTCSR